jgi:dihydrofolate synthase/folylpolyglutamate synthase
MDRKQLDLKYQAALDYLYSFVDYSLTRAFRYSADKFDLGRMHALMGDLGNPQRDYPVVHIAGTKGKGSTAALAANALKCAGYRVGLYISPHLEDFNERIQVNGTPISRTDLVALVEFIKPFVARIPQLTTFEITTAIGFLQFSRQQVEILVAEVGLGGRLDATNVIIPVVSVITSLSLDHMNVLGSTLTEIAGEKCGIIKPGIPVVSSPQKAEALAVIQQVSKKNHAPLTVVGRDICFEPVEHSLKGQTLRVWKCEKAGKQADDRNIKKEHIQIPLLGAHQMDNAATAYAALEMCEQAGLKIPLQEIKRGFKTVKWPGRFEIIGHEPLLIIDSAHNNDSARRLRQTLDDYLPDKSVRLLFGASEDKDISGILAELMPRVEKIYATRSEHPRALDPNEIADVCLEMNKPVSVINSVEEALAEASREVDNSTVILATGSIFIAAAVKTIYRKWKDVLE